jgi:hypothetical protein
MLSKISKFLKKKKKKALMHSGPDHDKRITQIFGFSGKKEGFHVPGTSIQAILKG